jgi:HTH-type transcriptional regulator/antitoxin HigA
MDNIKPIRNNEDLKDAIDRLNKVFGSTPGTPEADESEILMALIEHYEDRHYPDPPLDPIDAIRVRMDELGLKNKDIIAAISSSTGVSLILTRTRPLTLRMIRKLSHLLKLPVGVLVGQEQY